MDKHQEEDFKKPLQVYFANEEGLDAGGIRKEFFLLLTKGILDPQYGMFSKNYYIMNCPCVTFPLQTSTKKRTLFGSVKMFPKKKQCIN